jgi:hypothetical protein
MVANWKLSVVFLGLLPLSNGLLNSIVLYRKNPFYSCCCNFLLIQLEHPIGEELLITKPFYPEAEEEFG